MAAWKAGDRAVTKPVAVSNFPPRRYAVMVVASRRRRPCMRCGAWVAAGEPYGRSASYTSWAFCGNCLEPVA